jgi:DNA-binding transcriptional ArsR family regulator
MRTLGELLGSAARTELLRVLAYQPGPVGLRPAARLAGIHPRSAELALRALVDEGMVLRRQAGRRPVYEWNPDHPDSPVLRSVFDAAAQARILQRAGTLRERARSILPFIEEASRMLTYARRDRHVT